MPFRAKSAIRTIEFSSDDFKKNDDKHISLDKKKLYQQLRFTAKAINTYRSSDIQIQKSKTMYQKNYLLKTFPSPHENQLAKPI